MMNHSLKLFIKVAESGNITEAANDLYISQPAVSKSIRKLEEDLGVTLFHRDKRKGLVLTDAGEDILHYARQMAESERQIHQIAYKQKNIIGGTLRIASFPIVTSAILSKVIYKYRNEFPDVRVELIDRDPQTVQKLAADYAVDFGISASPFNNLDHETIIHDRIIGIYREEDEVDNVNLYGDTSNLIFCEAGKITSLDLLKDAYRIRFNDSLIVQNHETILTMVEEGNGIGVISEFTFNSIPNNLNSCQVNPNIDIDIAIVAPDLDDITPAAKAFISMMKEELSRA